MFSTLVEGLRGRRWGFWCNSLAKSDLVYSDVPLGWGEICPTDVRSVKSVCHGFDVRSVHWCEKARAFVCYCKGAFAARVDPSMFSAIVEGLRGRRWGFWCKSLAKSDWVYCGVPLGWGEICPTDVRSVKSVCHGFDVRSVHWCEKARALVCYCGAFAARVDPSMFSAIVEGLRGRRWGFWCKSLLDMSLLNGFAARVDPSM